MPTFRLRTPFGTEADPTPEHIAETLRAADRATDDDTFAVVERDDGVFVQLSPGGSLEVGGSGPTPHRLDHAALALQIVERLRRRQDPWADMPHWDLAPLHASRLRGNRFDRAFLLVILLAAFVVAAIGYVLLR